MPTLAKLTRPKTHRALQREQLFAALDAARDHPLIWVASPPGAGKTTLVSSYIEQRKLRALWFQVDAGDEDIATFFYYLAMAAPGGKRDAPLPQFLPAHRADLPGFCRHFFRALFARAMVPALIVLDNYHELGPGATLHALLEPIVAEMPEQHALLVISRAQPPPTVASLQLNGRLAMLDWNALRLSLAEARQLAGNEASVDDATVKRLHGLADGWAAGIAMGVRRPLGVDPRDATQARDVVDMFGTFAEQLLKQAAPDLRDFLMRTALLPTLTAENADALSGREDSAALLEDLHRRGLFINRRATRPPVYQYHDLFREFLLQRLEHELDAGEVQRLRRAAGALLENAGQSDHAIRLYLAVHDWEGAKRSIASAASDMLGQGRVESLRDWVRALPPDHATDPWMRYWLGAALARLDPLLARAPLAEAWAALAPGDDPVLRRLVCAAMVLTFAFEYSDVSPLDEWGGALLDLLEEPVPFPQPQAELHVLTAALFALGQRLPRPEGLQRCVMRALQLIDAGSAPPELVAAAAGFLLVQHFSLGTLREGQVIARRLEALQASGVLSPLVSAMSSLQLGHMALRTGEGAAARDALIRGLEVARSNALSLPMVVVFSNLGLAFEALQRGDLAQAEVHRRAIEEATAPDRKTDRVAMLRIHFWTACHRGQWELALTLAEKQLVLSRECGLFSVILESYMLLAMVHAHAMRAAPMEAVLREVEALIEGTAFAHLHYQCDMARAWCALRAGERERAHDFLARGLAGSRGDEARFLLRMQPLVLAELLGEALRAGIDRGYALQLIQDMRVPAPPDPVEDWPWPVRVYTLGRFEVQRHGRPLEFSRKAPKKTLALLKAIIALGASNVREQRLLDIFWPDEEGDVAMRSLTAALHRLRALLDVDDALIQQGGVLSLNPACVWVDALALDARPAGHPPDPSSLLALYRGSFLLEDEGEPWSVTMRERLRSRFVHALGEATARLERDGQFASAIECYLRGIDADPVIESFYQGLMRCHAGLGQRSEAVAAYRRLKHILSVTLALKPSAATENLYQSLRLELP